MSEPTPRPDPDTDAFILSPASGPYNLSVDGKFIQSACHWLEAARVLHDYLERIAYWPEVWLVNERGNTELLVWNSNTRDYDHAGIGYV